ncbi:MAG: hypothetical protein C5B55_03740, partial [Blastocatellia bacterium]
MSDQVTVDSQANATASICHICGREHSPLLSIAQLPSELQETLKPNAIDLQSLERVCPNCVDLFKRAKEQLKQHAPLFTGAAYALPTPVRMDADARFTGRGVTIAFLDSGFYAHKDLTEPENRIVAYHSIFPPLDDPTLLNTPDVASWHGMMTSVVAAGNGFLSDGLYRGIAPNAKVVLVKIGKTGHIPENNIQSGLLWVLENREKYDIRIVNISAGG